MELKGKKINFLGDSITQGVGTSDETHIYHPVIKARAGLADAVVVFGGRSASKRCRSRFDCG